MNNISTQKLKGILYREKLNDTAKVRKEQLKRIRHIERKKNKKREYNEIHHPHLNTYGKVLPIASALPPKELGRVTYIDMEAGRINARSKAILFGLAKNFFWFFIMWLIIMSMNSKY
jgi:hypothetical protein|tara:strand:+ start:126 stop:476 length:351 start_codon:yes stop_codon:yes gene_type:complete